MAIIGTKDELVRFSFVQVWEPKAMEVGAEPKYSVQVLIPKKNKHSIKTAEDLVKHAIKVGIEKGKINDAMTKNQNFRWPLRDGDVEAAAATDGSKDYLKGHMFFNASAQLKQQPAVVDRYAMPIMRQDEFYSGCYGIVDVGPFAYKNKGMGVAFGLNSVMKREDGERMDNRVPAEKAFAEYKDEMDDNSADGELR